MGDQKEAKNSPVCSAGEIQSIPFPWLCIRSLPQAAGDPVAFQPPRIRCVELGRAAGVLGRAAGVLELCHPVSRYLLRACR